MAAPHFTKVYGVVDAKIAAVTADPSGGPVTYGSLVDVPGIKEVKIGGDVTSVELRGDNTILDQNSTLKSITFSVTHAKVSLDALVVMLGGAVADSGTGAAEVATYALTNTATMGYWRFEAKTPTNGGDVIGGDVHYAFPKCILTSYPEIGHAEEDYQIVSFEAVALPTLANGAWQSIVINETAAAIA